MFKHYLNFKDLPLIGKIQVSEPFGFDGQSHKVKQDDGRYGRDVIIANETIKLKFLKDHFEFIDTPQMLIDGVPFNHASHGFEYLAYLFDQNGWESEVEYIIEKNGTSFTTGIIDFFTANVKEDEIEFSIIQNTNRELIKRREDIYIDAFSDKDLDGNTIIPCQTSNILLRAKSKDLASEWTGTNEYGFFESYGYSLSQFLFVAPIGQLVKYNIDDSFVVSQNKYSPPAFGDSERIEVNQSFTILKAKDRLTNVEVKISDLTFNISDFIIPVDSVNKQLAVFYGYAGLDYIATPPAQKFEIFNTTDSSINGVNENHVINIPVLEKGQKVAIVLIIKDNYLGATSTPTSNTSYQISFGKVEITATSTAIDTVIKGVRLIDLIKHNVESISGLPVSSNVYDIGGKNYDNFAFNGSLVAKIPNAKFSNTFKDLMNVPKELNCDYQINSDGVEILHYNDFYRNNEIGVLIELPNEENEIEYNKRYFLKTLEYGYNRSSFEKSNTLNDSLEDVHTKSQFAFQSTKTDGNFKIELKHIRSSFLIDEQNKIIIKDNKQKEYSDDLFLLDVIPLEGEVKGKFSAFLDFYGYEIYSDDTFAWNTLGFNIGDTIYINSFASTVLNIQGKILTTTLNLISFNQNKIGTLNFIFEYILTNVDYISRGEENFTQINGVSNPKNYANLKYHIKRNLKYFESYLATAGKYIANTAIKNTVFRVNDKLETKMYNENALVKDKSDIAINDIAIKKILNPIIHNITVFCEFEEATDFFKKVETEKGFVRIKTIKGKIVKGYPMEADYSWTENKLTLKLEEKYEGDYLTIDKVSGTIFINSIGYGMNLGLDNFKINNNFVCLYDINNILIANPVSFEKIKINNVLYTDLVLFSNALFSLI